MSATNALLGIDPSDLATLTAALIDISSVSQDEKLICDCLQDYVPSLRDDVKIMRFNNSLVVQVSNDASYDLPIVFAGHIDTVPPAVSGDSASPSRIDGDKLFGLGAADMKSGIAVMLKLLQTIKTKSTFIFYEGEEIEDEYNGLCYLAENNPDLLQAKWAILLEPTDGQLELGCQGSLNALVKFNGIAAHSARPHLGENAIYESLDTLNNIESASQSIEAVEISSMIFKESLQITTIHGGNANNVLPELVTFNLNYRFLPSKSVDEAKAFINELCGGADLIEFSGVLPGAMPAYDHPLVEIALNRNIKVLPKVAWTDVSRFYGLGITALNCGPGLVEMCHRADEHTSIKLLNSTYELLKELADNS